jgi:hypothetical protein|tara:strand:- start:428 stop:1129 length:702 start_codon:yes stop_codon:yes gene_type:complete
LNAIVIIPVFNEEGSLRGAISSVVELYPHIDIVVIDDGSTDGSAEIARESGAVVLRHPYNMGYGVALQTGYKFALRHNYDTLVQMDGDGQHDPEGIRVLVEELKNDSYDIVMGSRFLNPYNYNTTFFRKVGIGIFRLLLHLLTGRHITDPTSGFQAMNRKVLELYIKDFFPCDYPDADLIVVLAKMRMRFKEVPVKMIPNTTGKSMHSSPLNVMYYIFKMILLLFLPRNRKFL